MLLKRFKLFLSQYAREIAPGVDDEFLVVNGFEERQVDDRLTTWTRT